MIITELKFDGTKLKGLLPLGTNMSALARQVGVTRQALCDISKGRSKPSADLAVKLVAALNISLSDLSNKKLSKMSVSG